MAHQRTPSASARGSPFHGATSSFTALLPPMFDAQPEELVVALYDFTPAATSTKSYLCLAFEAGDRIRVHSKDASGWWDGELLIGDSVAVKRGWFPSNFVKGYDGGMSATETDENDEVGDKRYSSTTTDRSSYQSATSQSSSSYASSSHHAGQSLYSRFSAEQSAAEMKRLSMSSTGHSLSEPHPSLRNSQDYHQTRIQETMSPIIQALALVKSAIAAHKYAHIQPSIACVISAIRSLLNVTNCLQRESPLLVEFPILGKTRKAIMANLAKLVALARTTANSVQEAEYQAGLAGAEGQGGQESVGVAHGGPSEYELMAIMDAGQVIFADVQNFVGALVGCGIPLPLPKDGSAAGSASGIGVEEESRGPVGRRRGLSLEEQINSASVDSGAGPLDRSRQMGYEVPKRDRKASLMQRTGSGDGRRDHPESSTGNRFLGTLGAPLSAATSFSTARAFDRRSGELGWRYPVVHDSATDMARTASTSSALSEHYSELTREHRGSMSSTSSATSGRSWTSSTGYTSAIITPSGATAMPTHPNGRINVAAAVHATQDAFSSTMAALIGHVQAHTVASHPSSHAHIIDLTREAIDRVRDLLTMMENIMRQTTEAASPLAATFAHASPRIHDQIMAMDRERNVLYETTGLLVEAAEVVASAPHRDAPTSADEANQQALLMAISTALRVARECCRLCKVCAVASGDWYTDDITRGDGHAKQISTSDSTMSRDTIRHWKHGRNSSTASALGRTKFGWETTDDEDEEELINTLDEDDYTLHAGQMVSRQKRRPSLSSSHTTPVLTGSETFLAPTTQEGSHAAWLQRSNSFASPTSTPRIPLRHSPSPSVDTHLIAGDTGFSKTPRPGFSRQGTENESVSSHTTERFATPKARPAAPFHTQTGSLDSHISAGTIKRERPVLGTVDQADEYGQIVAGDMSIWLAVPDHQPKDVIYHHDGSVSAATLSVLVEKLTPHDAMVNTDFLETFFATFRLFSSPGDFLEALELRFDTPPPARMEMIPANIKFWNTHKGDQIRLRVLNVLRNWLELHWKVDTDNPALPALQLFLEERLGRVFTGEVTRLMDMVKGYGSERDKYQSPSARRFSRASSLSRFSQGSFSPMIPINLESLPPTPPLPLVDKRVSNTLRKGIKNIHVTDFNALELARQLTLLESKLFADIKPEQLLVVGQKKSDSLTAASTLSNQITGWVADSILGEQDLKKRTLLLKYFIKLADRCLDLQNFSTLFSVLAGLNGSTVTRLRRTWEGLPTKYKQLMEKLRHIIEHTKNHSNYRSKLRSVEPPALPFLGLILTDITFTYEGNPKYKPSPRDHSLKLINFDKYTKLGKIAVDFQKYQTPYNLVLVNDMQLWLSNVLTEKGNTSIDALYRRSLLLEPRQGAESISNALDKPSWLVGRI